MFKVSIGQFTLHQIHLFMTHTSDNQQLGCLPSIFLILLRKSPTATTSTAATTTTTTTTTKTCTH